MFTFQKIAKMKEPVYNPPSYIKDEFNKRKAGLIEELDDDEKVPETEEIRQIMVQKEKMWKENKQYYLYREMGYVMVKYGKDIFKWLKENEPKELIPLNFLEKHKITSKEREKLVDWMVEVFARYNSSPCTLDLAVQIMDQFIAEDDEQLKRYNLYLIALTCIYIASKLEDNVPLRIKHVARNIGHKMESRRDIRTLEKYITKALNFDFYKARTYDYLSAYFMDLKMTNFERIKELEGKDLINRYLRFCLFLSKLLLYDEYFSTIRPGLNFLAILTVGYDVVCDSSCISKSLRHLLRDWIYCITAEFGYSPDTCKIVYTKIYNLYNNKIIVTDKIINSGLYKYDEDDDNCVKRTNLVNYYDEYFL